MSFCLRVVPRFGGNVNINKPLAACNGTSTQYFKSFHLISALETWNARDFAAYLFTLFCPLFTSGASFSIAHEYSVRNRNETRIAKFY